MFIVKIAYFLILILGYAGIAQLVEQLICNQQVVGSSPSASSTFLNNRKVVICELVPYRTAVVK